MRPERLPSLAKTSPLAAVASDKKALVTLKKMLISTAHRCHKRKTISQWLVKPLQALRNTHTSTHMAYYNVALWVGVNTIVNTVSAQTHTTRLNTTARYDTP